MLNKISQLVAKDNEKYRKIFILTILSLIFLMLIVLIDTSGLLRAYRSTADIVIVSLLFLTLFVCTMLYLGKTFSDMTAYTFIGLIFIALLAVRLAMLDYRSSDYNSFLVKWLEKMRSLPGLKPITETIGDYNMPYMYILYFISRLKLPSLYLLKFTSIIFDVFLAVFAMKLVGLKRDKPDWLMFAFLAVFAIPTVMINSAYWGQCDSIYTALCIAALYYGLVKRPVLSMSLFALAFSFKLQTIFILPVILLLINDDKIKIKHIFVFPVVFFSTLLPAILVGKPFFDTISIYLKQTQTYQKMTLNAPSLYALLGQKASYDTFKVVAIILTATAIFSFLYFYLKKSENIKEVHIVEAAFIFSLMIPFLLPAMHERYFYMADVLSFIYFIYYPKRWYYPVIIISSSFGAYSNFIFGGGWLFDLKQSAVLLGLVLILLIRDFYRHTKPKQQIALTANL